MSRVNAHGSGIEVSGATVGPVPGEYKVPHVRFGKTELMMPLVTCGGACPSAPSTLRCPAALLPQIRFPRGLELCVIITSAAPVPRVLCADLRACVCVHVRACTGVCGCVRDHQACDFKCPGTGAQTR